jgi:hypothetical protein
LVDGKVVLYSPDLDLTFGQRVEAAKKELPPPPAPPPDPRKWLVNAGKQPLQDMRDAAAREAEPWPGFDSSGRASPPGSAPSAPPSAPPIPEPAAPRQISPVQSDLGFIPEKGITNRLRELALSISMAAPLAAPPAAWRGLKYMFQEPAKAPGGRLTAGGLADAVAGPELPPGRVWVLNPQGKRGHIPIEQIGEATAIGYTLLGSNA